MLRLLHANRVPELLVQRLSSDLAQPQLPERYVPIRDYVEDAELRAGDLEHASAVFEDGAATGCRARRRAAPAAAAATQQCRREPPDGPRCRWPWDQLYLTAAGEMLPCCMVATADRASFGNVFGGQGAGAPSGGANATGGLVERWHGDAAQAFRAALADDEPPAVCRSCALYHGTF